MKKLATAIASGFGSGFIPFGPGTWGTAVASLFTILLYESGADQMMWWIIVLAIIFTVVGYWAILELRDDWIHDDQRIVVDEMIGLWITLILIPIDWTTILLSFILFRFFDILKPLGIRRFDNIDTHWAVIVDDIVAGVYANITLRLILVFLL